MIRNVASQQMQRVEQQGGRSNLCRCVGCSGSLTAGQDDLVEPVQEGQGHEELTMQGREGDQKVHTCNR